MRFIGSVHDMVVRLPRIDWAIGDVEKEQQWLPKLAPFLPLAIPVPLAKGQPGEGYPWELVNLSVARRRGSHHRGHGRSTPSGGRFGAIHSRPPTNRRYGRAAAGRGVPLAQRDAPTRAAIENLHGLIDTDAATALWDAAIEAPAWHGPPVWVHGDLRPGNLLAVQGRLSAVIDFGGLGVGDPACDVMAAWMFLSAETRNVFRAALQVDHATWVRGRGWALSVGLIALPYYQTTNPDLAGIARRAIHEALVDYRANGIMGLSGECR